ncbi:MAG: hypothetical protein ACTSUX_10175 [Promethearchaeota archaeon]
MVSLCRLAAENVVPNIVLYITEKVALYSISWMFFEVTRSKNLTDT